jgi:hypothetical protein
VKECHRILRRGGILFNRYAPIEDVRDDPEHRFFPGALEIDKARILSREQVEEWFRAAGFTKVSSITLEQHTFTSAKEHVRVVELKNNSALTLISQSTYKQGLETLRRYVAENPNDPWLTIDRLTLTTGYRAGMVEEHTIV